MDLLQLDSMERLAPPEPGEVRLTRSYELPCSAEEAWKYFSHTDWLNRAVGLPPVTYQTRRLDSGELVVEGESVLFRNRMRWREYPFQWLRPVVCGVQREFYNGPLLRFRGGFDISPGNQVNCTVRFLTAILPRNEFGKLLVSGVIGPASMTKLDRAVDKVRKSILSASESETVADYPPLNVTKTDALALKAGLERLQKSEEFEPFLLRKLHDLLERADDVEVSRLRPFVVAQRWGAQKWDVVSLFLHATRAGLLDLSWEVLCPSCGEDSKPKSRLNLLRQQMHCGTCEVGFGPEFDRSVELKFTINRSIRNVSEQKFCLGGVNFRQRIVAQATFPPESTTVLDWPIQPGRYRLRSEAWVLGVDFSVSALAPTAGGALRLIWEGGTVPQCEAESFAGEKLEVTNRTLIPLTLRVEKLAEANEVLTAREVTNWQEFRDLFSSEVLSPGEQLVVGRQILLFTDLKGSTVLYQTAGDAQAYSRVREHFEILVEVLREHRGALVKTIGDAVMAVFSSVSDALNAAVAMHRQLADQQSKYPDSPLQLKSAVHAGPCLMITANGILDCFGSTVNYAARLLGESAADSLVLSDPVYQSEEGTAFFKENPLPASSKVAKLRGFDEGQKIWLVRALRA